LRHPFAQAANPGQKVVESIVVPRHDTIETLGGGSGQDGRYFVGGWKGDRDFIENEFVPHSASERNDSLSARIESEFVTNRKPIGR
jgi:hypothetical protein